MIQSYLDVAWILEWWDRVFSFVFVCEVFLGQNTWNENYEMTRVNTVPCPAGREGQLVLQSAPMVHQVLHASTHLIVWDVASLAGAFALGLVYYDWLSNVVCFLGSIVGKWAMQGDCRRCNFLLAFPFLLFLMWLFFLMPAWYCLVCQLASVCHWHSIFLVCLFPENKGRS